MRRFLLAVLALTIAVPSAALAHEDVGRFEDVVVQPKAGLTISVQARLIYPNDGEGAKDATVTAVAEQPGAPAIAPSPLEEVSPGQYEGTITVSQPGTWTVRLTSLSPAATSESTVEVAAPTTTTAASTTTEATLSTPQTAPLGEEDEDGGGSPAWIAIALVVAIGLGVAGWQIARRRRPPRR